MQKYTKGRDLFGKICIGVTGLVGLKATDVGAVLGLLCAFDNDIIDATLGKSWEKYCEENYKPCDANATFSGGVGTQTYHFELGKNTGAFGLSYEFYDVPDQIYILYGGKAIYNTGCKSYGQSVQVPFPVPAGKSTSVSVDVWGDCTGKGSTGWDFTIHCPF